MQWFYIQNGQRIGPVEESEIFRLAREGLLAPADLLWNPSMGQEWKPASSIPGLFTAPIPAESGTPGTTPNRDLMARALDSLRGQWALAVGITLLYGFITNGLNIASEFGSPVWKGIIAGLHILVAFLISGPLMLGWNRLFLTIARRHPVSAGTLFEGFKLFWKSFCTYFLMTLIIFLWFLLVFIPGVFAGLAIPTLKHTPALAILLIPFLILLFVLSLLPAIRATLAYAQAFFLLSDHPEMGARETLRSSKELMDGFKWKLFCLGCRFIGWAILAVFTCFIGFLWLSPYMSTAYAHFYEDIRKS